jgi:hypothetical protein
LAATIVEEEMELAATFVEEELELVAPFLPINRHRERESREIVSAVARPREKEGLPRAAALLPCVAVCVRAMGVEFERSDPPPPCVL